MHTSSFIKMLASDFNYKVNEEVANGCDIYYEDQWVGSLILTNSGFVKGFVIQTKYGNHLKVLCLLHEQPIITS